MAHSLVRIKGSLVNTPHLITEDSFNSIMDYVNSRIEGNAEIVAPEMSVDSGRGRYVEDTQTGVMHINGPLTYRTTGWEALCGGTSYEMLKEQMEYFVSAGAKTVVMMVDSGGGEAHGMMDGANYVRKLADENDIRIIAYVDGMSASAAYGFSCIADEIVMSSDSMVGSIGVLIQLMNNSKALEMQGYERTFVTAGKDKVPFAKDGSFTESFIERLQEQVDTLYEGFTSHVAQHRSLEVQAVKDTEANVFMAEDALKLGLADKVMTVEEFYEYAADVAQQNLKGSQMNPFKLGSKNADAEAAFDELQAQLKTETEARAAADSSLATALASLEQLQEQVTSMTEQLDGFKAEREAAEKAAADAIVTARTAALAEVVPAAEVETYLSNMSAMDEGAFTFMVGQLAATKAARAEGFKAVGEEGAEEDDTPAATSTIEKIKAQGIARAKALRA
ncbi:MAG: hypothetical protein [Caudoviricetes sp.]|nr:MAG: hypothetical protein [Caudoviricetes sp.]